MPAVTEEKEPFKLAMERAGHLLSVRPRSIKEIQDRLLQASFETDVVSRVIDRLVELGLLDDASFADQWVEQRARGKGLGASALASELRAKGIDGSVAEAALAGAEEDEEDRAIEVAHRLFRKVARKPLRQQAGSLFQMLARRGFGPDACKAGVASVMPPEGWD